jgi:GNAT superfamily N-acetyltransferase
MTHLTTYYLEMTSPSSLKESTAANGLKIVECEIKQFQFNRFLYQLVGGAWQWTDKNAWTNAQWQAFAENENLRTWVGYVKGSPAGYFELQRQGGGDVEIAYFGLAPRFIGRGLGGCLLARAIKSAWVWQGTRRVWVHTCSLDHPRALPNYLARGLVVYNVETATRPEKG